MKKAKVTMQVVLCVLLSFLGLVNSGVWIWMAGKTKQRGLRLSGIIFLVVTFVLIMLQGKLGSAEIEAVIMVALMVIPMIVNFINLKNFMCCQNIWADVKKNEIDVRSLSENGYSDIQIFPDEFTIKNSHRLFGNKGEAVLRAIRFKEWERQQMAENKKLEKERVKEETKRAETEKAKAEAKRAEMEKEKAQAEKARAEAEAEKMRAEAEVKKLETERLREQKRQLEVEKEEKAQEEKRKAEAKRAEAEQAKTAQERAERAKKEQEKAEHAEAGDERGRAEADLGRIQREKVDINTCTEQELSLVPGIGIITAKKAIQIRSEKGRFSSVEEFIQEAGIRGNKETAVRNSLVCLQPEQQGSTKKHGRKIDL